MFTSSLLALLALSAPASAADPDYAACTGKTGAAMQLCRQGVDLAATKRQLAALEATCSQVCTAAPAAPAAPSAPRTSSGPSKTQLAIEDLRRRVTELETLTAGGIVSDEEFRIELERIQRELDRIGETLADHERRIKALEDAAAEPPPLATPPIYVPGPQGPAGADGKDGKDGSGEYSASVGVTMAAGDEWAHTGLELTLSAGGRPTDWLVLGGYANGHVFALDSLGFAVGGAATIRPSGWDVQFPIEVGWREAGIHFVDGEAKNAISGIEARSGVCVVADVGFTARFTVGGWFPGGDDGLAVIGQASAGWRF